MINNRSVRHNSQNKFLKIFNIFKKNSDKNAFGFYPSEKNISNIGRISKSESRVFGRESKQKSITLRFRKPLMFLVVVLFLGIGVFFILSLLKVREIETSFIGLICDDSEQIREDLNKYKQNILFINSTQIKKDIQKKYPCVGNLIIQRQFLNRLKINVVGRIPIAIVGEVKASTAQLTLKDLESSSSSMAALLDFSYVDIPDGNKFLVDESGFIFSRLIPDLNLANISLIDQEVIITGQINVQDIKSALLVLKKLEEMKIVVHFTKITPFNDLLVSACLFSLEDLSKCDINSRNNQKFVFSLKKNIDRQLASLQLIWEKAKIDSRIIDKIDLRFDKPVVIYSIQKGEN